MTGNNFFGNFTEFQRNVLSAKCNQSITTYIWWHKKILPHCIVETLCAIRTNDFLHHLLIVLPQLGEDAPARVSGRDDVFVDPAPACVQVEVLARVYAHVQRGQQHVGGRDAGWSHTVTCGLENTHDLWIGKHTWPVDWITYMACGLENTHGLWIG